MEGEKGNEETPLVQIIQGREGEREKTHEAGEPCLEVPLCSTPAQESRQPLGV